MNEIEAMMWQALGRAMRAKDDALALALFNEYRDYQSNFLPMETACK